MPVPLLVSKIKMKRKAEQQASAGLARAFHLIRKRGGTLTTRKTMARLNKIIKMSVAQGRTAVDGPGTTRQRRCPMIVVRIS